MVRKQVRELIDGGRFSQNKLAAEIGISAGALSQYLSGKYTGDNESIKKALSAFISRQKSDAGAVTCRPQNDTLFYPAGIVETQAVKIIRELALRAYRDGEICVSCGEAGSGKTSGVKAYAYQNGGTVVITANVSYTAKVLFQEIAENLDVSEKGSINDVYKRIKRKLNGIKKTVIIDEAEHLPYRALDLLRSLQDECGFGLVLVGTLKLIHNLKGNQNQYAQLFSRVSLYYKIPKMNKKDLTALGAFGIGEKLAERCAADTGGNFRLSAKFAKNIKFAAEKNGMEIDENIIQAAKSALVM